MHDYKWSKGEKKTARQAFDKAYDRECEHLMKDIKKRALKMATPRDIWSLRDYLEDKSREVGLKYDYRYSMLIGVFGRLMGEGWLTEEDLEGLREEKISRIVSISDFIRETR